MAKKLTIVMGNGSIDKKSDSDEDEEKDNLIDSNPMSSSSSWINHQQILCLI